MLNILIYVWNIFLRALGIHKKDRCIIGKSLSITIPNHILIPDVKQKIDTLGSATNRVHGFSMRIFLENGRDKVTLSRPNPSALKRGDVVLAEVTPKVYVLHRIIHREGDNLTLMGDGNVAGTESCTIHDVIGTATAFYRKGRSVPDSAEGKKWKIYSKIWLALTPVRRWILAFYRRIWLKIFPVKTNI